jgi:hypothetical protein
MKIAYSGNVTHFLEDEWIGGTRVVATFIYDKVRPVLIIKEKKIASGNDYIPDYMRAHLQRQIGL